MSWEVALGAPGRVHHLARPRFSASWTSGADAADYGAEPGWTDVGGGEFDALHLFAFAWLDAAPEGAAFERLMQEAGLAIEARLLEAM